MDYIIKNCPAIFFKELNNKPMCNDLKQGSYPCYECSDCLLKRIYNKAKECNCGLLMNDFEVEEIKE